MSTRIEWSRISDAELAEPRQLEDQYGSVNEGPALAFFTGSDGAVVEADSWGEMAEALASSPMSASAAPGLAPFRFEGEPADVAEPVGEHLVGDELALAPAGPVFHFPDQPFTADPAVDLIPGDGLPR